MSILCLFLQRKHLRLSHLIRSTKAPQRTTRASSNEDCSKAVPTFPQRWTRSVPRQCRIGGRVNRNWCHRSPAPTPSTSVMSRKLNKRELDQNSSKPRASKTFIFGFEMHQKEPANGWKGVVFHHGRSVTTIRRKSYSLKKKARKFASTLQVQCNATLSQKCVRNLASRDCQAKRGFHRQRSRQRQKGGPRDLALEIQEQDDLLNQERHRYDQTVQCPACGPTQVAGVSHYSYGKILLHEDPLILPKIITDTQINSDTGQTLELNVLQWRLGKLQSNRGRAHGHDRSKTSSPTSEQAWMCRLCSEDG